MSEWAVLNQGQGSPRNNAQFSPPPPLCSFCAWTYKLLTDVSAPKENQPHNEDVREGCGILMKSILRFTDMSVYLVSEMHPEIHQRLLSGILKKSYFTWLFSKFWLQSCWPWSYILHLLKFGNDAASWWISLRAQWRWGNPQFSSVISDTEASENEK